MFIDKAKIRIKAGNGGNGAVSFFRDKLNMTGGPDGGDGGKGGNVIVVASNNMNTLVDYKFKHKFFATNGENGGGRYCTGKHGQDVIITVPLGCVVKDATNGQIVAELLEEGEKVTLLHGGVGGKGNTNFKSSIRQSPNFATKGRITEEKEVILELKMIADIGIIGYPNVGKSTFLSVVSDAKPKIANYQFTTLSPNLGVVKYYDTSCVFADIPGLIEGASEGVGLGHDFLRHIERTRLLLHIVDISEQDGRNAYEDYVNINKELKNYSATLAEKPQIIALNKVDALYGDRTKIDEFKSHFDKDTVIFEISGYTHQGVEDLLKALFKKLAELPVPERELYDYVELDMPSKLSYEIVKDQDGSYIVQGSLIDFILKGVNIYDNESFAYFQRKIVEYGIEEALLQKGANYGDSVHIGGIEFELNQ